jgi:hypothetical protein
MKQKKYKVKEENVKKLQIYLSKIDGGKENK